MSNLSPNEFQCTKCGDCCKRLTADENVLFFDSDVEKISSYLGISTNEFRGRYLVKIENQLTQSLPYEIHQFKETFSDCPFLGIDNTCAVHLVKPDQCARGPFGFFFDGQARFSCMEGVDTALWNSTKADQDFVQQLLTKKDENVKKSTNICTATPAGNARASKLDAA